MKYYVIAGERSGDLHAGNLVRAIQHLDPTGDFCGIGGDYMSSAGVKLSVNYNELAFMGFVEVVKNYNTIRRYLDRCKEEIIRVKPDVVILVDYGGFNRRIAAFCNQHKVKVFYYITPKVWAWYTRRALELKRNVDRMFVILPFEKDFYKRYQWDVDYVGNPVLDAVKAHQPDSTFLSRHGFHSSEKIVALLPGSRKQELKRMLPVMRELVTKHPELKFAVAVVGNLDRSLYEPLNLPNVIFVVEETYDLLKHAYAAVVTSGTATLETGLFKVPQVVIYKAGTITYLIARSFIKVKYISLINLIANKEVIKELIQAEATPDKLNAELNRLIHDEHYRQTIQQNYEQIYKTLDVGSASNNAASLMVQYLKTD